MDRFSELQVFQAVVQGGGFAKAARKLHMSPPAVTRAISGLEERLGVRLLVRTTRSLALTEAGERFLADIDGVLSALELAERQAAGASAEPRGHLRVTASMTFGRLILAPAVSEFLQTFPQVSASLLLVDRIVNLAEEGIDLGIRIADLPDSGMIARRVGQVCRALVASPDYLARHGVPTHPRDLAQHRIIAFTSLLPSGDWRPVPGVVVNLKPAVEVNDAPTALAMAERGEGITNAFSYVVAEALRAGRLVRLLPEFMPAPVPVHLVHPQGRLVEPKLRAFMDFVAPHLEDSLRRLWLDYTAGPAGQT